jgi:hypothetical protein
MLHVQASQAGKLGKACWQVYQAVVLCSTSSSGSNASCKAYVSTCLLAYAQHMTLQTQADALVPIATWKLAWANNRCYSSARREKVRSCQ